MSERAEIFGKVLAEMLEVDPASIDDAASQDTIEKWNSMTHMKLIARLEESFEVRFKVRDVVRVKSIGDLKQLLAGQGVELA